MIKRILLTSLCVCLIGIGTWFYVAAVLLFKAKCGV